MTYEWKNSPTEPTEVFRKKRTLDIIKSKAERKKAN